MTHFFIIHLKEIFLIWMTLGFIFSSWLTIWSIFNKKIHGWDDMRVNTYHISFFFALMFGGIFTMIYSITYMMNWSFVIYRKKW